MNTEQQELFPQQRVDPRAAQNHLRQRTRLVARTTLDGLHALFGKTKENAACAPAKKSR